MTIKTLVLWLGMTALAVGQGVRPPVDKLSLMRDVTITNPLSGDALQWNGSKWVNQTSTGQTTLFNTDYRFTQERGIPWVTPNKLTVTFSSGQNTFHGSLYLPSTNSIYLATDSGTAQTLKVDAETLATTITTVPVVGSSTAGFIKDMVYVTVKSKIYALVSSTSRTRILEIDPVTLVMTRVVEDTTNIAGLSGAICSDGSSLFVISYRNPCQVIKYSLTDFSTTATTTITVAGLSQPTGHRISYDGQYLYATGYDNLTPFTAFVARISPSDLTNTTQAFSSSEKRATDDMAMVGDNLWIGFEGDAGTSSGVVAKVKKSDLSITLVPISTTNSCFGMAFDGRYVWGCIAGTPGSLIRIEPTTNNVSTLTLDSGENTPNELLTDGARLFVTCYLSPAKLLRITSPSVALQYPPVSAISMVTPNVLYTTPVTFASTAGAWAGTLSLNAQAANTVFGNFTSGSATPTFTAAPTFAGTNLTGTAASLTSGHVTTNANLTGDVTSVGNATTLASIPAISGANLITLNASNLSSGTVPIARVPTGTTSSTVPLGGVITGAGPTGSSTVVPVITYNAAGQLTAVSTANIATGLTIGTTTIGSGTGGRILYDNAGVVGEMTTTGSGTVLVLATSPTFTTGITIGAGSPITSSGAGGALGTNAFTSTAYAPLASPTFTGTVNAPTTILTEAVGASALTLTGATQTSNFPVINATQTWNASGTTFTGIQYNVTSTASAAASLLMDLQVGGSSKFKVDKTGSVTAGAGISASGSISTTVDLSAGATRYIGFSGRAQITSPADGIIRLGNNADTSFTRLDFSFATNSGPAIGFDTVNGLTLQSAAGTTTWNDSSTAGSGTVANRYLLGIAAPTLTATNSSVTDTVASTFYIGGAPTASTNTTIGTAYALNIAAGDSAFGGNIIATTAGKGLQVKGGSNAKIGTGTLTGGTVTISTTAVTANSRIFITDTTTGSLVNVGSLVVSTKTAGSGFVVTSTNALDASTFDWMIVEQN